MYVLSVTQHTAHTIQARIHSHSFTLNTHTHPHPQNLPAHAHPEQLLNDLYVAKDAWRIGNVSTMDDHAGAMKDER